MPPATTSTRTPCSRSSHRSCGLSSNMTPLRRGAPRGSPPALPGSRWRTTWCWRPTYDPGVTVAILGLGEAGGEIAGGLAAAGVRVSAWDPAVDAASVPPGVGLAGDAVSAVRGATAALGVNAAAVAVDVAREVAPALEEGQLYADLNTAAPALKAEVATVVEPSGALFADVALMAPVPGRGL